MRKPNILFILTDDQRADTVGALGNAHILTPAANGLVRQGTTFSTITTVPVCTPARAEILAGADAYDNGCRWFGEPIKDDFVLLPKAFQNAGYHTCHIGKWHNNGHPTMPGKGFSEAHLVFPEDLVDGYLGRGYAGIHQFVYEEDGQTIVGHSSEVLAKRAVDFLQKADSEKPWFCYLSLHSPHDPRTAPEPFASMYKPDSLPLPENFMPEHPFDNGDMAIRDELLEEFPRRPSRIQKHLADYYAMITHHDYWIGQVLAELRQSGQAERTIVVLTSDQGLAIGSHGLMGKENLYEHSQTVATTICGPGLPENRQSDLLACHYDLYPTLCELAGIAVPESVKGKSFHHELLSGEDNFRDTVCTSYRNSIRSIRNRHWKLIHYPGIKHTQLFDLSLDPNEASNLLAGWRINPAWANGDKLYHAPWEKRTIRTANELGLYPEWPRQELDGCDMLGIAGDLASQLNQWLRSKGETPIDMQDAT